MKILYTLFLSLIVFITDPIATGNKLVCYYTSKFCNAKTRRNKQYYFNSLQKELTNNPNPHELVDNQTPLCIAVQSQNFDAIRLLLKNNANPNAPGQHLVELCAIELQRSFYANQKPDYSLLRELLHRGADPFLDKPEQEWAVSFPHVVGYLARYKKAMIEEWKKMFAPCLPDLVVDYICSYLYW